MRPFQLTLLSLIVLLSAGCKGAKEAQEGGQEETSASSMTTSMPDGNQFLFWQIRHPDTDQPSYLYGTIHVIGGADYFLGENVRDKLLDADRLIMEIDFDDMDMSALATKGLLPEGKTMKDYLPEADYEFVANVLSDSIGLSRSSFEMAYARMKPLFVEQLVIYRFLGENPMSYENHFEQMAEGHGIESDGLETFEEQLEFLDLIPLEQQFEDLVESVRDWEDTRMLFQQMVDAYVAQDLEMLNELIMQEMTDEKLREQLLDKRNEQWVPKLDAWLQEGNAFIAVGAGHLAGEEGLIQLLREAGYEVWPYPPGESVE